MKIVIAGGTGFIGSALVKSLLAARHDVVLLTRHPEYSVIDNIKSAEPEHWDGRSAGPWMVRLDGADAVINLSGESIAGKRWTMGRKKRILASRVESTRIIVEGISRAKKKPRVLVNMSGIGHYGHVESGDVTELNPPGGDFLSSVTVAWENEACAAEKYGTRVVLPRLGMVLGSGGGALTPILRPFRLYVGGSLGNGRQFVPWIHIEDVLGILIYSMENPQISGAINAVAPQAVTMNEFCKTLGKVIHRPSWMPVPGFLLRLMLGEMADLILKGQRAVPLKLEDAGYKFKYPSLEAVLESILVK